MNILKIISIILIILIILGVLATFLIGNYFVNYAIYRKGDGAKREIVDEESIIDIDDDIENLIETNRKNEDKLAKEWSKNIPSQKVEITSFDNITLRGTKYLTSSNSNKWAIVLHGYHATPNTVLSIGMHLGKEGFNVLIPSMRACSESDGDYIGMGWLDKEDLKGWINLILEDNPSAEIILHGSSMGAATVLMVSGDELPQNVKAIVADSGYTSVWDIFASEAKARFNLPTFPILNMFEIVANIKAKYDIKEASSLEQVKKSKTPILYIHGDSDDFVPEHMCEKLFEATFSKKDKLIIEGAGHTDGKYKDSEKYYTKMFKFINEEING